MADEINTLSAGRLRQAMKAVGDNGDATESEETIWGDEVLICAPLSGHPSNPKQLVIRKGGRDVAAIYVTNGTMKKLRFEMEWWKRLHSGSTSRSTNGFGNRTIRS